jgi:hypothetical protein
VITLASHTKEDGWEEYTVRKKVSKLEKMMPRWGKKKKKTQSSQSALVFKSQGKDAGERGQIWKGV